MKAYSTAILILIMILGCEEPRDPNFAPPPDNWMVQKANLPKTAVLENGKSYLSIYSQIYSPSQQRTHSLTAMVSARNTSDKHTIYLLKAVYFDSDGKPIKVYFNHPIAFKPLQTKEIVINKADVEGGTGSNFIFEWKIPKDCPEPLFEGVMNSTVGQQGLSFTTQSIRIR